MIANEGIKSFNDNDSIEISKLANELCSMTGCDREVAVEHLMNADYDLQMATEKILESSLNDKEIDEGWKIINRQKKFKKKENKVDSGYVEENVKQRTTLNRNSKLSNTNANSKSGNYKSDEKQNYNRSRNKRNRNIRKSKENLESFCNTINDSDTGFDLKEEELRWDNFADIEGGLKESSTNSVDGFYSEEELGFPIQPNDDSYQGIGMQLISTVNNLYSPKIDIDNYSKSPDNKHIKISQSSATSHSNISDSKIINECLSKSLPIFGKYSKTELPKSLPIIPNKPVSFAISLRFRSMCSKVHYRFGDNISDELTNPSSAEIKFMCINNDKSISMSKSSNTENLFQLNPMENKILSSNPNFNQMNNAIIKNISYESIINTIIKQKNEVAILLGQHPAQSCYPYTKPINLIPMTNSNSPGHIYSLSIQPENFHTNIENGMAHQNQDCFMQNSFPSSINTPAVPYHHLARK